eukprot:scaffold7310_cov154-Skeletonema_dohrnii-CCMP3373.AAC.6
MQQREKGAAPLCYVGIVQFYGSFFEGQKYFWKAQHKDDYFVSILAVVSESAKPNKLESMCLGDGTVMEPNANALMCII